MALSIFSYNNLCVYFYNLFIIHWRIIVLQYCAGPTERTGHRKHPLPTTQEISLHMDITRWSIPKSDWLYSLQLKREKLYSQQKQDQELTVAQIMNSLIAKFRIKWKKVGKTTRPFRYDLNQIPYDYTEVTNRFKGLDLIECPKDGGLWHCIRGSDKTIPKKKKGKRAK